MGFETLDTIDQQAMNIINSQTTISENLSTILTYIDSIDIDKNGKNDALMKLTVIKKNVQEAQKAIDGFKEEVSKLRPLISAEKEKIVGKGKTKYTYKCEKCSANCEETYKFKLNDLSLKICKMNSDNSADFKFLSQKDEEELKT
jgi:hypothetical protein